MEQTGLGPHNEDLASKEEALAALREAFPADHPDVLRAMGNLAITFSDLGRHEEAKALRSEIVRLRS
jgi:tetratricopeptide (TPR) repeat protein